MGQAAKRIRRGRLGLTGLWLYGIEPVPVPVEMAVEMAVPVLWPSHFVPQLSRAR